MESNEETGTAPKRLLVKMWNLKEKQKDLDDCMQGCQQ